MNRQRPIASLMPLPKHLWKQPAPPLRTLETQGSEGDQNDLYRVEKFLCDLLRFRNGPFARMCPSDAKSKVITTI
jgi:hypothetical protein